MSEQLQNVPEPPQGWQRFWWLGPGFLWMVSAAGSGEMLFTPRVAAQYGYALLWAMLAAVALKWFTSGSTTFKRRIMMVRECEIRKNEADVLKGAIAGLIGGLVASWTMNKFQAALTAITESIEETGSSTAKKEKKSDKQQEPATVKGASAVSEGVFGHELIKSEKEPAGEAVHYATGGVSGAVYGAAAELMPAVTLGGGIPFGTAVWLVVDEGAVPLFGFSKSPTEYPASTHAYALASHFVYGVSTEVVRRAVRRVL